MALGTKLYSGADLSYNGLSIATLAHDGNRFVIPIAVGTALKFIIVDGNSIKVVDLPFDAGMNNMYWRVGTMLALKGDDIWLVSGFGDPDWSMLQYRHYLWDGTNLTRVAYQEWEGYNPTTMMLLPSGNLLVTGSNNGTIDAYTPTIYLYLLTDTTVFTTTTSFAYCRGNAKQSLCIHPSDGKIWLFNVFDGGRIKTIKCHETGSGMVIDSAGDLVPEPNNSLPPADYPFQNDGEFPALKSIAAGNVILVAYQNWDRAMMTDYWGYKQWVTHLVVCRLDAATVQVGNSNVLFVSPDDAPIERVSAHMLDYVDNQIVLGYVPWVSSTPTGDIVLYKQDGERITIGKSTPVQMGDYYDGGGSFCGVSDNRGNYVFKDDDGSIYLYPALGVEPVDPGQLKITMVPADGTVTITKE
jgi:hypothetical protein